MAAINPTGAVGNGPNPVPGYGSVNNLDLGDAMNQTAGDDITVAGTIDLKLQPFVTPGRYLDPQLTVNKYGVITSINETPDPSLIGFGDVHVEGAEITITAEGEFQVATFGSLENETLHYNDSAALNETTGLWTAFKTGIYGFSAEGAFTNNNYNYTESAPTFNPMTAAIRLRRVDAGIPFAVDLANARGIQVGNVVDDSNHLILSCTRFVPLPAGAQVRMEAAFISTVAGSATYKPTFSCAYIREVDPALITTHTDGA